MADLDALRDRLDSLAEDLSDASLDLLKAALHGDDGAKALEKRVTRARRAVEKASHLLAGMPVED
jgi:predicted kinase